METQDIINSINEASNNARYDVMASSCHGARAEDAAQSLAEGSKYIALSPQSLSTYTRDILNLIDVISEQTEYKDKSLTIDDLFEKYLQNLDSKVFPEVIVSAEGKHLTKEELQDFVDAVNTNSLTEEQDSNIQNFIEEQPEKLKKSYNEIYTNFKNDANIPHSIKKIPNKLIGPLVAISHVASPAYEATTEEILKNSAIVENIFQNDTEALSELISKGISLEEKYEYPYSFEGSPLIKTKEEVPLLIAINNNTTIEMVDLIFQNTSGAIIQTIDRLLYKFKNFGRSNTDDSEELRIEAILVQKLYDLGVKPHDPEYGPNVLVENFNKYIELYPISEDDLIKIDQEDQYLELKNQAVKLGEDGISEENIQVSTDNYQKLLDFVTNRASEGFNKKEREEIVKEGFLLNKAEARSVTDKDGNITVRVLEPSGKRRSAKVKYNNEIGEVEIKDTTGIRR